MRTISIDGIDGAGKGTQCKHLAAALEKEGRCVTLVSFPVYDSFFGGMVSCYLNGRYGSLYSVDARLAALLFALDRREYFAAHPLPQDDAAIVIFDRYVLSNMAHQGVKVEEAERPQFMDWLCYLEYEIHRIPRADLSIVLDIPAEQSKDNVTKKERRAYTGKTYDLHENDADYLGKTRALFLELAKSQKSRVIVCAEDGHLKSEKVIAGEILEAVSTVIPSRLC